jgi:hypothetical protein
VSIRVGLEPSGTDPLTYRHSDLISCVLGFILAAFHEQDAFGNATLIADQESSLD